MSSHIQVLTRRRSKDGSSFLQNSDETGQMSTSQVDLEDDEQEEEEEDEEEQIDEMKTSELLSDNGRNSLFFSIQ